MASFKIWQSKKTEWTVCLWQVQRCLYSLHRNTICVCVCVCEWVCTWPQAIPMPLSPIPWGQDRFNSNASAPDSYTHTHTHKDPNQTHRKAQWQPLCERTITTQWSRWFFSPEPSWRSPSSPPCCSRTLYWRSPPGGEKVCFHQEPINQML